MTTRTARPRPVTGARRHTGQPTTRPRPRRRPPPPDQPNRPRARATLEQRLRNYRHLHRFGVNLHPPLNDVVVVDEHCRPVWPVPPHILRIVADRRAGAGPRIPTQRRPDMREVIRRARR